MKSHKLLIGVVWSTLLLVLPGWAQEALDESAFYAKSWAVVIGINSYENFPSLEYAINDATAVATRLKSMGFEVISLLDTHATRENILQTLQEQLPTAVGRDDRLVIFYAGHGAAGILSTGEEVGFIIPSDGKSNVDGRQLQIIGGEIAVDGDYQSFAQKANFISVDDIRNVSDTVPAKHILYIIDGCYSGFLDPAAYARVRSSKDVKTAQGTDKARSLVIESPTADKKTPLPSPKSDPARYFQIITARDTVQILTAGSSGEAVYEKSGHGLFTHYLLQALDGAADKSEDPNAVVGDCVVTATELGNYLKEKVPSASNFSQSPLFNRLSGEGEFIFVPSICKPIAPVDMEPPKNDDGWAKTQAYRGPEDTPYEAPTQVLVDSNDYLYVLDSGLNRMFKFDPQGNNIPDHFDQAPIEDSWKPTSMALGYGDTLWVYFSWTGDSEKKGGPGGKIVIYQPNGRSALNWNGTTEPLTSCAQNSGEDVPFPSKGLLALDFEENVIMVDQDTGVITKCDHNGKLIGQWGKREEHTIIKDISQYKTVTHPQGLAIDMFGYIYVADTEGHGIQKYRYDGEWIPSWPNVKGDKPHFFNSPHGLAVDSKLYVYVADTENHRIKKYTSLNAKLLTYWGKKDAKKGNKYGEFREPTSVAVNQNSTQIYVADTGNKRVQRFFVER